MKCNAPLAFPIWHSEWFVVIKDCKKCIYRKSCSDKNSNSYCYRFRPLKGA